jgi:hypothetical protein
MTMITDTDVKNIAQLPGGKLACVNEGDKSIVHGTWLVLEFPATAIEVTKVWPGEVLPDVRRWRYTQLPESGGESASVYQVETDDGKTGIKLQSDNVEVYMQQPVFEFLQSVLDMPSFKLFPGTRSDGSPNAIAIFDRRVLVGAVAAFTLDSQKSWLTE